MNYKNLAFILLAAAALLLGTATLGETARRATLLSSLRSTTAGAAYLSLTPQPRQLLTPAQPPHGTRISLMGVAFLSPWGQATHTSQGDENVNLQFPRGTSLSLFRGSAERFLNFFNRHGGEDAAYLKQQLGDALLRSPFRFYQRVLASTPAHVSPFSWAHDIRTELLLLSLKKSLAKEAGGNIWKFSTKTLRGFQIGNPASQQNVVLYLFAPTQEYDVIISGATQQEIDTLLSSFTPSPAS